MGTMLMTSIIYLVLHPYVLCMGNPVPTTPREFYEAASAGEASIIQGPLSRGSNNRQTPTRLTSFVCNSILHLVLRPLCKGNPVPTTPREFYEAASAGEASIIQDALSTGNSNDNSQLLNWRNGEYSGYSALHIATEKGHGPVVRLLLEAGADPNMKGEDIGRTPVLIAVGYGHTTVLKIMLESKFKADVDLQEDKFGVTPVYLAVQNGNNAALKLLVDHGADVDKATVVGTTPVYAAAQNGHTAALKLLVDHGADVDKATVVGVTPVYAAAQQGHTAALELLVAHGADVDKVTAFGTTPVYAAAQQGHTAALELLVAHGADVDKALQGQTAPLKFLEDHADVDTATVVGATPVYAAAQNGHTAALELLVAHGADVDKATNEGASPLTIATQYGHAAVVRILINAGANIGYARPSDGHTALHSAAFNNHKDVARILLRSGADKSKQQNDGDTPADLARRYGHNKLASFIDNY